MLFLSALVVSLLPSVWALFPDEAYKLDYHHALLGLPQQHTTFFHQPRRNSKASLIYTLSDRFLVGAVNPKNGSLVWRQELDASSTTSALVGSGHESVVSGVDNQIASWNALDGRLIWSRELDLPGKLVDLNTVDTRSDDGSDDGKDIVALFQAATPVVQKLDGKTGAALWQYRDSSSDVPFRLVASADRLFVITLGSSLKKTKVTILHPLNGQRLDQLTLSSDDVSSLEDLILVSRGSKPVIGWPDKSRRAMKINVLGTKTVSTFPISMGNGEVLQKASIHAPNLVSAKPHFLIQYQSANSHWGEVFHVNGNDAKATTEKIYDVGRLAGKGTISVSIVGDKVYFTRIAQGTFLALDSDENKIVDHYQLPRFWIAGLLDYPDPILAVSEASSRSGSHKLSIRAATLFNTGDWALILNGEGSWVRHEGLGYITAAAFADLPKKQTLAHELEVEGHSTVAKAFIHRIQRHVRNLQKLPDLLQKLPENVVDSFFGKSSSSQVDNFGFHKHVVVATEAGRLIALDTMDQGKLVWSTKIPDFKPGQIPQLSASPSGVTRVKTDTSHDVFDTLTGKFLRKGTDSAGSNRASTAAASVRFVSSQSSVSGFLGDVLSDDAPIWTFYPQAGEVIANVTMRATFDPVASIGEALGDRRVLYKYLNPNLLLVTAVAEATSSITFYVIDGVSGNTIYTTTQYRVDVSQPIPTVFSENFFIYSLTLSNTTQLQSRGYLLGIAKFFESYLPDDRGALGAANSFSTLSSNSSEALEPHVVSQTFHISEPLTTLAVSRTAQGISTRLLLATLKFSGGLLSMPLPAIDPRRPVGRAPTKDEQAEGLTPYGPNLEFDPRWISSHKREVRGLKQIIAAPSGMESTGLVFAYGGDVFGTRVTPSGEFDVLGEGFAKGNMVGTVVGLLILVLGVAPIVARKANGARWSVPQ